MTDERLKQLLRGALTEEAHENPSRDLWVCVSSRCDEPARWSYVDLGLVAAIGVVLALFPEWFWLLAYHL